MEILVSHVQAYFIEIRADELAAVVSDKNVYLEDERCHAYTDENGLAIFNLRFLSGIPGDYNLFFESNLVKSSLSKPITLINPAARISVVASYSDTFVFVIVKCLYSL